MTFEREIFCIYSSSNEAILVPTLSDLALPVADICQLAMMIIVVNFAGIAFLEQDSATLGSAIREVAADKPLPTPKHVIQIVRAKIYSQLFFHTMSG